MLWNSQIATTLAVWSKQCPRRACHSTLFERFFLNFPTYSPTYSSEDAKQPWKSPETRPLYDDGRTSCQPSLTPKLSCRYTVVNFDFCVLCAFYCVYLCILCILLRIFVHFMHFIVYVCTALLPLGEINDNNNNWLI